MGRQVLTDDEREAKAITKSRWMTLRDSLSSTQSLGFRVDAVVTSSFHKTAFQSVRRPARHRRARPRRVAAAAVAAAWAAARPAGRRMPVVGVPDA